jgi:dCTP deaminase
MILCDRQIRELALAGMIEPFVDGQVRERKGQKLISYGLSSAGYDLQLGPEFVWPISFNPGGPEIDPKAIFTDHWMRDTIETFTVIEPGEHILGCSVEYLRIPDTIVATAVGKSTYARCGLIINVTPLEPGWEGQLTIEMHNASLCPIRVYPGEGICQIQFHRIERPDVTYGDRNGKYQGQRGVTLPRV